MKKHLKKIFFAISLMVLTLTLASCGPSPKFDLEKAAENLERRDYYVSYNDEFDEDDYEEMMMVESLYAYDDDDEEVSIRKFRDVRTAKLYVKSVKLRRQFEIDYIKLEIKLLKTERNVLINTMLRYAFKLESDDFEDIIEDIKDIQDEIKECREEIRKIKKEYTVGRIGKTAWSGTKEAIKDTK